MSTRITKSKTDRVIDGVCGGLAEYFGIDSLLVRLAFVALMFINGLGVILYIVLVIIMPKAESLDKPPTETIQENVQEMGERIKEAGQEFGNTISKKTEENHSNRAVWFGILLILIGVIFLLKNFNFIRWFNSDLIWPLIIILIGAWLLIKRWR